MLISIIFAALFVATLALFIKNIIGNQKQNQEKEIQIERLKGDLIRFNGIVSVEEEIDKKSSELENLKSFTLKFGGRIDELKSLNEKIEEIRNEIEGSTTDLNKLKAEKEELIQSYSSAKTIYNDLQHDIDLYKNDLDFIEIGVYEPIFNFDTSEKYKQRITALRDVQKEMIKEGRACVCNTNWVVGDSRKKGEIMVRRYINLSLRAFNGECDTLISKVKWNNVARFEERIQKAFVAINKLGESNDVHITYVYLESKIEELKLVHEFELKKYQEKEEEREIREQNKEEERAQREFEKAAKIAENEEKRYQKALEQAQRELGLVSGTELEKLQSQIDQLQKSLTEAQENKERAISRAQETKSGHVYVISNIGSFGDDVFKIGMTRRLEPLDRVRELGDASVPFRFDVHALIFTENAPELENLLHKEFEDRRLNRVNNRKEFFRVSLDEIENVIVDKFDKEVEFVKLPEAQEYRETKSILHQIEQAQNSKGHEKTEKFPDSLF